MLPYSHCHNHHDHLCRYHPVIVINIIISSIFWLIRAIQTSNHKSVFILKYWKMLIRSSLMMVLVADLLRNFDIMTSSNGNICRVTGHLCGKFTGPGEVPHTKANDAELWCFLWYAPEYTVEWGWWFQTPSRPLWRHCNGCKNECGRRCVVLLIPMWVN